MVKKNTVTLDFSNNNFEYSYLSSFSGVFAISDASYNILSSLSYSKNCSYFSNNRLTLLSNFSCPLNQDFCYDFTGGYLDLYLFSSLDVSLLNQCSIKFITDVGSVIIPCSTINFVVSSKDSSLIVCSNTPNLVFSSPDCKKLLGIRLIV